VILGSHGVTLGGYRPVWNRLSTSGLSVDFVGSLSTGPTTLADKDHEGHGGAGISTIVVNQWLNAQQPDMIALMIGTNDMFDPAAGSSTSNRLSRLIKLPPVTQCKPYW